MHPVTSLDAVMEAARSAERLGSLDEAIELYERALDRCRIEGDAARVAVILRWIGNVRRSRGDIASALELYEASLAIATLNGLAAEEAAALNCMAITEQSRGEVDQALLLYCQARDVAGRLTDDRLLAMVEQNMGALANLQGRLEEALAHYEAALEGARRVGDETTISHALNNIGMANLDLEQWDAAERSFAEAFELAESMNDLALAGTVALNRSELYLRQGRAEEGRIACDRALAVFNVLRSKPSIGEAYKLFGVLYREMEEAGLADAYFASALGLAETCDDLLLQAETQVEWASLHLQRRRWKQGILYLNRGLLAFGKLKASRELLDIRRKLQRAESIYIAAVREWARTMEEQTTAVPGHSERVVALACALAESCGIADWDLTTVRVAGLIHEVGRVAVDRCVPAALQRDQAVLERLETIAGDALTRQLDFPVEVRRIVRSQRERWDGTGYPDRLAGTDIPIGARILSITDAFDRLTRSTPHFESMTAGEALALLRRESGRAFDPGLLGRFEILVGGGDLLAA